MSAKIGWSTHSPGPISWLIEACFPRFCLGCGKEGSLLCTSCDAAWLPSPMRDDNAPVVSLAAYADPIARGLLTAWKYQGDWSAWEILKRRLAPELDPLRARIASMNDVVVAPVPLSRVRYCLRGFDQAAEIARWLASEIDLPYRGLLSRREVEGRQAERSPEDRRAAMKDSPFALQAILHPPSSVLLVDDVWTTGATTMAAADVLRSSGVETIIPVTILRGGDK